MQDIDDFDPLDDLLLSDEELPKPKTSVQPAYSVLQKAKESDFDEEAKKEKKKKIIAELFGSQNESKSEETPMPSIPKVDKSDWLALKTETTGTFSSAPTESNLNVKNAEVTELDARSTYDMSKDKTVHFADDSNIINRRRSEARTGTLAKTKHRFKSLDLDLFGFDSTPESQEVRTKETMNEGNGPAPSNEIDRRESISIEKEDSTEKDEPRSLYTPSGGSSRRFGVTKSRTTQLGQTNWLSVLTPENTQKLHSEDTKDFLPQWLGQRSSELTATKLHMTDSGISDNKENETYILEDEKDEMKTVASEDDELRMNEDVKPVDEIGSTKDEVACTVVKLKKKQDELQQNVKSHAESLSKREREIQDTAFRLIHQQRDNMKALLEIISFDNFTSDKKQDSANRKEITNRIEAFNDSISQLQIKLTQNELEKVELEMKSKHMERKYMMDLSMLEEVYRCKLQMTEEREAYYKNEIQMLEDEFNLKLSKRKEEEEELALKYNEKIRLLKEEHLDEMKRVTEIQNLKYPWMFFMPNRSDGGENSESSPDKNLILRELAVQDRQKELLEFEERLNKLKIAMDGKESSLNTKTEEYDMKIAKEKLYIDQQKKDLKLARNIFEEKQMYWQRELQREKDYINSSKEELEVTKEDLLKEERKLMKGKFEVSVERARLEAIMSAEGSSSQAKDCVQSRAELQGTIDELRRLKSKLEHERNEVKLEDMRLKEESWKLREIEQQLRLQQKDFERLLLESEAKREEGMQALKKAKKIESEIDERVEEVEKRSLELKRKEDILIQEKVELSKERDLLTKRRYQLDMVLPQLTYEEQLPFNLLNQNILDPRLMMMKLRPGNQ